MIEHIVLVVVAILAALFIIRVIIKIAKGEDPCMFCKSCGDGKQDSCCALKNEEEKKGEEEQQTEEQQEETKKD
jgi:hypothetical protein